MADGDIVQMRLAEARVLVATEAARPKADAAVAPYT